MTKKPTLLDLGHGHTLRFMRWAPDDLPENRKTYGIKKGQPMPVIERAGAVVSHPAKDGTGNNGDGTCTSAIHFDTEETRRYFSNERVAWTVESWEPLTISPSLLCLTCGDHGFIRDGRWVRA